MQRHVSAQVQVGVPEEAHDPAGQLAALIMPVVPATADIAPKKEAQGEEKASGHRLSAKIIIP